MKKILNYFKQFHTDYFNVAMYLSILAFTAVLIFFNYKFDIEDGHIDKHTGTWFRLLLFFLIHGLAYYGVIGILYLFRKEKTNFKKGFWWKSLLGLLVLSNHRNAFGFAIQPIYELVDRHTFVYFVRCLNNAYGWITIVLVLTIIKFIIDKKEDYGIYGLRFKKIDIKVYIIMLGIMVPVIFAASQLQQFIDYYPLYSRSGGAQFAKYYQIKEVHAKLIYEFFYLTDFLNTELIFRGFLVIGLAKFIGKDAILPMAATYAVLHFGKPVGETISSIFGGYILGIIALYSRNIWGGVFLHGGIALLMEVFAFLKQ